MACGAAGTHDFGAGMSERKHRGKIRREQAALNGPRLAAFARIGVTLDG
ncbi:MAG TPA: hypothetical protein VGD91_20680 [Trebonia sp.]